MSGIYSVPIASVRFFCRLSHHGHYKKLQTVNLELLVRKFRGEQLFGRMIRCTLCQRWWTKCYHKWWRWGCRYRRRWRDRSRHSDEDNKTQWQWCSCLSSRERWTWIGAEINRCRSPLILSSIVKAHYLVPIVLVRMHPTNLKHTQIHMKTKGQVHIYVHM